MCWVKRLRSVYVGIDEGLSVNYACLRRAAYLMCLCVSVPQMCPQRHCLFLVFRGVLSSFHICVSASSDHRLCAATDTVSTGNW